MIILFVVALLFSFWDRRANRTWESSVPEEKRDILPLFRSHIYGLGKKISFLKWSVFRHINQGPTQERRSWPKQNARWFCVLLILFGLDLEFCVFLILFTCFDWGVVLFFTEEKNKFGAWWDGQDLGGVEEWERIWSKYITWKVKLR